MDHSIKISVAQLDVEAGHAEKNFLKISSEIQKAKQRDDQLIIFPEMCVSGYLIGDDWLIESQVKKFSSYNEKIRSLTDKSRLVVVWGNVDIDEGKKNEDGSMRKYNAAFIAQNGKWLSNGFLEGKTYKSALPNYGEFDDKRYFYSLLQLTHNQKREIVEVLCPFEIMIKGIKRKIGIIICEDQWASSDDGDYLFKPVNILINNGAEAILNISCSPWKLRKNNKRHRVVRESIKKHNIPVVYCNNTGVQNNGKNYFPFDGSSTIYNADGSLQKVAAAYTEQTIMGYLDMAHCASEKINDPDVSEEQDIQELNTALVYAIKRFFKQNKIKKAVIGLSGGIDSAVSMALLTQAIGKEQVYAINMPTQFNTNRTKTFAKKLAQELGVHYAEYSIQHCFERIKKDLSNINFGTEVLALSDINLQNIQARIRGSEILAGIASALGGVFINNGNKTESAFGYATLYGDIAGALAPLGDLYKGEIYQLAYFLSDKLGAMELNNIAQSKPSAELSDDQNVEAGQGDPFVYAYHDKLVRAFVEFRRTPYDLEKMYDQRTLEKALLLPQGIFGSIFSNKADFLADLHHKYQLFQNAVFKRVQSPPNIRVSRKGFGYDLRESIIP